LQHLVSKGARTCALSRLPRAGSDANWIVGDLEKPETLKIPAVTTLYCTTDAVLLARALPHLLNPAPKRVVAFSSTSVLTKLDSEVPAERKMLQELAEAEQTIVRICEARNIGWTILRPTLIYAEGRDINITPLSRLIRRFGFMPLVGGAAGLRQPVHAEDLAIGAIAAAASPAAVNKFYALPGGETLPYKEMIGRIFDGMKLPRRTIPCRRWSGAPPSLPRPLFPDANVAMGLRLSKDMTFDATPAVTDFGWRARAFHPVFDQNS